MNRALVLLFLIFLAGCIPAQTQPTVAQPSPTVTQDIPFTPAVPVTAIVNGTILTGTDSEPIPDGVILIQAYQIVAVGTASTIQIPDGAEKFDALGGTVLPGFINTHIHSGYSKTMLQQWLQGGVTTVRDEGTGSGSYLDKNLAAARFTENRSELRPTHLCRSHDDRSGRIRPVTGFVCR